MKISKSICTNFSSAICAIVLYLQLPAILLLSLVVFQSCADRNSGYKKHSPVTAKDQLRSSKTIPLQYDPAAGFEKLNAIRQKHYLSEFKNDLRLQKAAQDYADLMGARGLYGHEIGPGTDFKSRIFAVGFNQSSGENIGVGYRSIDDALKGWLASAGHKRNMLKRDYTLAGLAYSFNISGKNPRYTHFWVLIMGRSDKP